MSVGGWSNTLCSIYIYIYIFPLVLAEPYLMDMLVTSYARINVCACLRAWTQKLWGRNTSQQIWMCIPDRHRRSCACMRAYVHSADLIVFLMTSTKKRNVYFCVAYSLYFSTSIHRVTNRLRKYFNISWMRVPMSYNIFNNLLEFLNEDLSEKTRQGRLSKDLKDRECNYSLQYKFNRKCV